MCALCRLPMTLINLKTHSQRSYMCDNFTATVSANFSSSIKVIMFVRGYLNFCYVCHTYHRFNWCVHLHYWTIFNYLVIRTFLRYCAFIYLCDFCSVLIHAFLKIFSSSRSDQIFENFSMILIRQLLKGTSRDNIFHLLPVRCFWVSTTILREQNFGRQRDILQLDVLIFIWIIS